MVLSATGTSGGSAMAVSTEAAAVTTLTPPANQYWGFQRVQISMKWVAPQAAMKTPKATNMLEKGSTPRPRSTKAARVIPIPT